MKKSNWISTFAVVAILSLTLTATGCVNQIRDAIDSVSDSVTTKTTTIDYLNKIIDATKISSGEVNDWAYTSFNNHLIYIETNAKECSYLTELTVMADASDLMGDKMPVEDESVKNTIEPKLKTYIDSHKALVESNNKLANYCKREAYKDDKAAQMSLLTEDLENKMGDFVDKDEDLNKAIKEIQRDTDLGISEDTTDPYDMITLVSDKLTNDVEDAHDAYADWVVKKANGENPDTTTLKNTRDKLKSDISKYKKKADDVNAKDASSVGSYYSSYINAVDNFDVEYEKFVRDAASGELTEEKANELVDEDQTSSIGSNIYNYYGDVIDAHNRIVGAIES